MPIFSVIIPHKNCPELLKRCIESVPDSKDIEIILIDDNSDDKPLLYECLNKIERSNLIVIESSKGGWAGGSRNIGLDKATGKWILFLDADDFFVEGAFDSFYLYVESNNDILYYKHQSVYTDTLVPCIRFPQRNKLILDCARNPSSKNIELVKYGDVVPWGKMIRRSLIEDNNIRYNEIPCCEDVMFMMKCASKTNKVAVEDNVIYCLTYRESSLTMAPSREKDMVAFKVSLEKNRMLKSLGVKGQTLRVMSYIMRAFRRYGFKESINYINVAHSSGNSTLEGLFFSPTELKDRFISLFDKDSFQG